MKFVAHSEIQTALSSWLGNIHPSGQRGGQMLGLLLTIAPLHDMSSQAPPSIVQHKRVGYPLWFIHLSLTTIGLFLTGDKLTAIIRHKVSHNPPPPPLPPVCIQCDRWSALDHIALQDALEIFTDSEQWACSNHSVCPSLELHFQWHVCANV